MRLARPYRMAPLAIASALAAELVAEAERDPEATPIAGAEVAPPGFLNLRLRDGALESTIAAILADPDAWGRVAPAAPRSVNVEFVSANPTGPLHVGNARGAFIGDMLSRRPRGRRPAGHARVLLQRLGRPDPEPRRVGGGASGAASRCPMTATRRTTSTTWRRRCPADVWAGATAAGRRHRRAARPLGGRPRPRGHRGEPRRRSASTSMSGPARRASTMKAGSRGRSSGCASAATSTSRTARSGSARPRSATTRTGSSSARTASRPTSPPTSAT